MRIVAVTALALLAATWSGCAEGDKDILDGGTGGATGGGGAGAGGAGGTGATSSGGAPGGGGEGATGGGTAGAGLGGGQGGVGGGQGGAGPVTQACPPDQFATGLDGTGTLVCAPFDAVVRDTVNQSCSVYFGWRDSCDSCGTSPAKWGRADGLGCQNGLGTNGTCTATSLGGQTIQLYGLNTDGDVNDDDKFYYGLRCAEGSLVPTAGPCQAGEYVAGVVNGALECVDAAALVVDYVEQRCDLYAGWRDSCDGCVTAPSKWGYVDDATCMNGVGANDTCTTAALGGNTIDLFGLNTDGDVNDDDKFYWGLSCAAGISAGGTVNGSCPPGQLVTGLNADGTVECDSPEPLVATQVRAGCYLYAGYRDSCDGCSLAPTKWGRVSTDDCLVGAGVATTCSTSVLGGQSVRLLGVNTDGDVDDNDKFYVGMRCF